MERKTKTLGWKPKGAVQSRNEKIFEGSRAEQIEEWKGNDRTASEASMRSFTLSKTKNLNFSFQNALLPNSRVYHGGSWRLSNYHI